MNQPAPNCSIICNRLLICPPVPGLDFVGIFILIAFCLCVCVLSSLSNSALYSQAKQAKAAPILVKKEPKEFHTKEGRQGGYYGPAPPNSCPIIRALNACMHLINNTILLFLLVIIPLPLSKLRSLRTLPFVLNYDSLLGSCGDVSAFLLCAIVCFGFVFIGLADNSLSMCVSFFISRNYTLLLLRIDQRIHHS